MLLCPNGSIASRWSARDVTKAYRPASGLDNGQAEAQRFHEHLQKAAVEFERIYAERASLSAELQSLERLFDAAPGSLSLHPPLNADSIPRAPAAVMMPAPPGGPRTAEGVDCEPTGHGQGLGRQLADSDPNGHGQGQGLGREPSDSDSNGHGYGQGPISPMSAHLAGFRATGHGHGQGLGRQLADSDSDGHGHGQGPISLIPAHLAGFHANEHGNGHGLGWERGENYAQVPEGGYVLDQQLVEQFVESTASVGRHGTCDPAEPLPDIRNESQKTDRQNPNPADYIYQLSRSTAMAIDLPEIRKQSILPERPETGSPSSWMNALSRAVKSSYFDGVTCAVIVMNAIFMAFQMQYDGMVVGCELDLADYCVNTPDDVIWPAAPTILLTLDVCFTIFFCLELLLRAVVYRCGFFKKFSNWIDVVIVAFGVVSSLLPVANLTVARLLRLSKLSRMKNLKMNDWMDSLRFLVTAIMKSNKMCILSFTLLLVVQCIVGMMMNSLLLSFFQDPDQDLEARQQVYYFYGTYTRTMITLFEVHMANWSPACRVLVDNVGLSWGIVFVVYRVVVGFSLLNVISAVFIQTTMRAAENSMDLKIAKKQKERHQYAAEVLSFFQQLDVSKDGFVTWEELQQAEDNEHYRHWLGALGIEPYDLRAVFDVLDVNGDNLVAPQELMLNADRITGNAKSLDVVHLMASIKIIEAKLDRLGPAVHA